MSDTNMFPCPSCGAQMEFSPEKQALLCSYCKNTIEIENNGFDQIQEYPIEQAASLASRDWGDKTITIDCQNCGAQTIIKANETAAKCTFCDSPHVLPHETTDVIKPETLIRFKVTENQALDRFKVWLKKRWLSPNELHRVARAEKMNGIYIPFFTYDSTTYSYYTAEKGTYYYVNETHRVRDKDGNVRLENRRVRKTRWSFTSGTFHRLFDDILICASKHESRNIIKKLEPYKLEELLPYSPSYLAGFIAEKYSIGIDEAYNEAKEVMRTTLYNAIKNQIHADEVRNLDVNTTISDVKFKHILLPMWLSIYKYKGKIFRFAVNGQTGEVQGRAPISPLKLTLLILFIIALIVGALFIAQYTGMLDS